MSYAELQVTTHYSFLRGASAPKDLFAMAAAMGISALAITDRNSVAGVVRGLVASEELTKAGYPIRMIAGCRLDLVDGSSILVWPEDRPAWSRLTGLLSLGKSRANAQKGEKGKCFLYWEDVAASSEGMVAALVPGIADMGDPLALQWMADIFGAERGHLCLSQHRRPGDAMRIHTLHTAARRFGLTPLATGDILYAGPDNRMLQDLVTAIREKCTIDELGFRRERNADRHLKSPEDMGRRFRHYPDALAASSAIAERCTFSLRELESLYRYPDEIVMNRHSPQKSLEKMAWQALNRKFRDGPPGRYRRLLSKELRLVGRLRYAPYFLTVLAIVQFARSQQILCQGRGSAANSLICFLLCVTSIDPVIHELLFERFVSGARGEPPDIDIDFEHERREEVIQWIYETYGHDHAALTAVVSRFRSRGALREVGKAMGLSVDLTASLASQVWGWSNDIDVKHADALNLDRNDPRLALTLQLAGELIGTPRHLSQHPGGFVLAHHRVDQIVPIEPAAMIDRRVIEWEKDDLEALGLMKVDILGLGMLGCMRRCFDLLAEHKGIRLTLASDAMQEDDPATFEMICKADTLGVFQIESRAQMSMLPRLKPRKFYDIVIQVAIVRPGPIQGDMVHPYLRRREGKEEPEYPKAELRAVLEKTEGVPLFQEQAMKVAIEGAGFTPEEADALRRSMATFKSTGGVTHFREKMVEGMVSNGYERDFAERTFKQIEGFGSYGFPESHAASFAKIAYASSWMKCHHPEIFCAALLNAQPMGFYAPAQIIRDAREHGVEVRPVCINRSRWDAVLEEGGSMLPLRLGMRTVLGVSNDDVGKIILHRADIPFTSIEDVWLRSRVSVAALEKLARADAFHCFGLDRRQALWTIKGLGSAPLLLFAAHDAHAPESIEPEVALDPLTAGREVVEDYRATQFSLRAHPLSFLRDTLTRRGITRCGDLAKPSTRDGKIVDIAGLILVRQRPGSANGIVFITLEDETGIANAILWSDRFEKYRRTVMSASMLGIRGRVQREGLVIHVIAESVHDLTPMLRTVGDLDLPRMTMPGDGATHGGTIDPRDRIKLPRQRALESWPPRSSSREDDVIPVRSHDFH